MTEAVTPKKLRSAVPGRILGKTIVYLFLSILAVVTLFPIFYALMASFKSNMEILTGSSTLLPTEFHFENYSQAWSIANFGRYTWNSVYLAFFTVLGAIVGSTMGGYVFARGEFPGKKLLFGIITSTMFISLGSITLFPLLEITKVLHLNNTLWGVIVINVFGLNVTNLYLVRAYVTTIPREIDEAAIIDGCGFFKTFTHIIFPLLKPVIATVGLLSFRMAWNDYLLPMVFTMANRAQSPLVVGVVALRSNGEVASSWNLMLAGTMISILPMMIAYLGFNKYFVAGLTSGAVKG